MPATTDIQSLPVELLGSILSHVRYTRYGDDDIKQCRLVSRCFNNTASKFLFPEISVYLTLESFDRFEKICYHPVFGKSVQKVIIIVSYYESELACNKHLYMQEARARLLRHVETIERSRYYKRRFSLTDDMFNWLSTLAWGPSPELDQLLEGEVDETSATPIQKLFLKLYDIYKQRWDNQQRLRQDETHISRLCDALCSLSGLVSLELRDPRSESPHELTAAGISNSGFGLIELQHFSSAIRMSRWCGSFYTHNSATPPIEMLGVLCSQLGEKGLRPRTLSLHLTPPPDMRAWQLSSTQQAKLKHLTSQSTELTLHVDFDARHHTLRGNPRHEMLALCSITQPFFSAPNLESLEIWFKGYPSSLSSGPPKVSLDDILPLDTSWPRLETLRLRYQPTTISELKMLVAQHSKTIREFVWYCGWLLDGSWVDAFETLRGLHALEQVRIEYPDGAEFKEPGDLRFKIEANKISSYILKETDVNPLSDRARDQSVGD